MGLTDDAIKPIVEVAGTDISSWFEEGTGDVPNYLSSTYNLS